MFYIIIIHVIFIIICIILFAIPISKCIRMGARVFSRASPRKRRSRNGERGTRRDTQTKEKKRKKKKRREEREWSVIYTNRLNNHTHQCM